LITFAAYLKNWSPKEKEGLISSNSQRVAIRSEGAAHSHTRQALARDATAEEVYRTIILTTTIGFPSVSAALSWAEYLVGMAPLQILYP
jgi:hypothetical protein